MADIRQGRWTAQIEGDFVVFIIGARLQGAGLSTANVQYWRSFEHLEAFAKDDDDPHLATWRNYWRRVGRSTRTGIWHETYLVRSGEYEAIHGNMPPFGLGRASDLVRVESGSSARQRLRRLAG